MMMAANTEHVTIAKWDGALAHSAAAALIGTIVAMICNMGMMVREPPLLLLPLAAGTPVAP